jgi:hypothetical protein
MIPSNVILDAIASLLANDATTLANMTALHVHLAQAPFTPTPALDPTTLVEANFGGYAVLDPTAGAQSVFLDPVTGLRTVELKSPIGGWHFQTTGTTNLPQTIYGWYVTDHTDAVLYGSGLLSTPVPLTAVGQGFDLPSLSFAFSNNSPS